MPRQLSNDPVRIAWRRLWHKKSAASRHKSYWGGRLKREYGLSIEGYNSILSKQGFLCAACACDLRLLSKKHIHLDHCHKTKKIRGILCGGCNKALGLLGDSHDRIMALALYISKFLPLDGEPSLLRGSPREGE